MQFKSTLPLLPLTPGIPIFSYVAHLASDLWEKAYYLCTHLLLWGDQSLSLDINKQLFSLVQLYTRKLVDSLIQYMHVLLSYTSRCHLLLFCNYSTSCYNNCNFCTIFFILRVKTLFVVKTCVLTVCMYLMLRVYTIKYVQTSIWLDY